MKYEIVTGGTDGLNRMIAPAPAPVTRWQNPSPLFTDLFSARLPIVPWEYCAHLSPQSPPCHFPPLALPLSLRCYSKGHVWHHFQDGFVPRVTVPEGGIISLARGHQARTHTSRASLEVNVTEGAPTASGNRFPSYFVSLLSPRTLLKRPRSKAPWEVARRPAGEDTEGWWGEGSPPSASVERFWLKPHLFHHSFHHLQVLPLFFFFFCRNPSPPWSVAASNCQGENSLMWVRYRNRHEWTPSQLILRVFRQWRSHLL